MSTEICLLFIRQLRGMKVEKSIYQKKDLQVHSPDNPPVARRHYYDQRYLYGHHQERRRKIIN